MFKPVLQNHPIARKTCNLHANRENRRVFGVCEKTWIFHENLPNLWIRPKKVVFLKESSERAVSEGGPKERAEGRFVAKGGQQCMTNAHRMATMLRK